MHVKSLELVGYKTFASKTKFEFSDAITAVVGPNGSGKSNIADALRWVLGEQSYSLLRGKKTIDMIFSGSDQRPRAGMASATVTFDNTEGWLPIDFSEVAITRRAYRDGQNEYLINGQKVRLRDISELLARSGLAERTYTIIGQGLVDAALSLKAEERRKLFEEAAGIGVYRTRREDALKRLDTTRRNLERVEDILAELKPRLNSLNRQARRAKEYDQVKTDLHVLLREWYGYHWHHQQTELAAAREAARLQEIELSTARRKQSSFEKQISSLRDRIHNLRAKLNSWHRELSSLHNRRERLSRELAVIQERQRSLEDRRRAVRSEQTRLKEELRLHEERLERVRLEVIQHEQNVSEARMHNRQAQELLAIRQRERQETAQEIQQAERSISESTSLAAVQTARLDELKNRIDYLLAAQMELEKILETAEATLAESGAEAKTAESELEKASSERENASLELEEYLGMIRDLETQQRELLQAQQTGKTDVARLEAQLEVLEQAERAHAGYSAGSRALLLAQKEGRLQGVVSALSSRLEIAPEHENAVAAALGQFLDAIILESDQVSESALDILLKQKTNGAILALDKLSPLPPLNESAAQEGLGVLSGLVRCPVELRPVVDLLLGRFLLVENRRQARRIMSAMPVNTRLVTLAGEIFSSSGEISTGGQGTSSLISRSRQMRENQAKLERIQSELDLLDVKHTNVSEKIIEARKEALNYESRFKSARSKEDEAQAVYRDALAALEKHANQRNWQKSQLSNQRVELSQASKARKETELSLSAIESGIEIAQSEILNLRRKLTSLPLEDVQSQATHWHTQLAVTERALEDARTRSAERLQTLNDSRSRLKTFDQQISGLEKEQATLLIEQEKLKIEEGEIAGQIEEARLLIDPAEKELAEVEARQDAIQDTDTKARQMLTVAERNHAQAQIALARKQEALDSLRNRIEDDFGLVAFEYMEEISGPTPLPLGDLVESLPLVQEISQELGETIRRQRAQLRRMGAINPDAQKEHKEVSERFEFLSEQVEDLNKAEADIKETISELDVLMEREFRKTFDLVAREFRDTFTRLFGGGTARLVLTNPDDLTETGVDIEARLPGRRTQGLSLLSGGERSLTATALVFSLIRVSPTPFCVLDEVDAMLDEANVNRFGELLRELSERTQFIVITHNRNTVQVADTIYGITMGRDSTSQMLSLKLDEVAELV